MVPSSTAAQATTSNTLLAKSRVSRESKLTACPMRTLGMRQAYKVSEKPTTTAKNIRMNTPRLGSVAKACTEVSTPERTKNVPSSDSENALIDSNTVQALKLPRLSLAISEWISAVPTNQGMSEAFSTGSQNHQPPHPSS